MQHEKNSNAVGQVKIWEHFQNEGVDSFKGNAPRLDFLLARIERKVHGGKPSVLNIGVGNGYFELSAARKKFAVAALDPDHKAIERLLPLGIDAKQGLLSSVPFADAQFDFVVASEVLEHLNPDETAKALSEIRRVLKPGGYFIGTVPFNELLADKKTVCPSCGEIFHRWGHQQSFNRERMRADLSTQLEVRDLKVRAFVEFGGRSMRGKLKSAIRWVLGAMGEAIADPHLYFSAQKPLN
jgi:SAM-dependent methyltransferase